MDKKRGSHMGEPKVLDTICLFNHVLRDFGGPQGPVS